MKMSFNNKCFNIDLLLPKSEGLGVTRVGTSDLARVGGSRTSLPELWARGRACQTRKNRAHPARLGNACPSQPESKVPGIARIGSAGHTQNRKCQAQVAHSQRLKCRSGPESEVAFRA